MRSPHLQGLALLLLAACGPVVPEALPGPPPPPIPPPVATSAALEAPPLGRLPGDVRPTRYALSLTVDPARPRFGGSARIAIELDRPRDVIWIHGRALEVHAVTVEPEGAAPLTARWEQASPSGVAALRLPAPIGPGRATVKIEWDAPFGAPEEGLYVIERGGRRYAYTQLEPLYARRVFPCFDEPAWKTPYELTLFVPSGVTAIANTYHTARRRESAAFDRVTFAPTERLPSYLVAFAVGELDTASAVAAPSAVRPRRLEIRGFATSGRGRELRYALEHAPAIVSALEDYFGVAYPYDKLDLIAVPEMGGAMENAGAITFGESSLLLDDAPTFEQKATFAALAAHEIAHQWFGDLVTMAWWDDLWLNEAFATWIEARITARLSPELRPGVHELAGVLGAMDADSLVSARRIRQEIRDDHDIESAFDAITYDKGGGVLAMFERWIGPETFQRGIRGYLAKHRAGTATADDLLAALSAAAQRDVGAPFRTFLQQPGLPFVEATLLCDPTPRLALHQSRFLPIGSTGGEDHTWQIPICARFLDGGKVREACALLTERDGSLPLPASTCPAWVMPNADGAGYYRWSLDAASAQKLGAAGYASLGTRERMSLADSLKAGFARGRTGAGEVLPAIAKLAADPSHAVASAPMELLDTMARWLEKDPLHDAALSYGSALYGPVFRELGWEPKRGRPEDPERSLLRRSVISFLARSADDRRVRREAAARGRAYAGSGPGGRWNPAAVSAELAGDALAVAVQEGDAALFGALEARLGTEQRDVDRRRILAALGAANNPELGARARALALDPRVHGNEVTITLRVQLDMPETRDAAWSWLRDHLDALLGRMSGPYAAAVISLGASFCDRRHAEELEKMFATRAQALEGGPRNLAAALEQVRLCAARREAQEAGVRAFFAKKRGSPRGGSGAARRITGE
jgi:alanyl aminopeptidase